MQKRRVFFFSAHDSVISLFLIPHLLSNLFFPFPLVFFHSARTELIGELRALVQRQRRRALDVIAQAQVRTLWVGC